MKMYNDRSLSDENRVREKFLPNLALARAEGLKLGRRLKPAYKGVQEGNSRLALIIDPNNDFDDDGRLPVKGTFGDFWRTIKRLTLGIESEVYTSIIPTIDFHPPFTVHGDTSWRDTDGRTPDVNKWLAVAMVLDGQDKRYPFIATFPDGTTKRFKPVFEWDWIVNHYAPHLIATGQGPIMVWKDHCRMGTDGTNINPAMAECLEWAAAARGIQVQYMFKGHVARVDWFGPFCPCMVDPQHPQAGLQTELLENVRANAATDVFGEAGDFCVKHGMKQVLEYYGNPADRPVLERVNFVRDCTSYIFPDDPSTGKTPNADFNAEMAGKGVKMITHDTPFGKVV